MICSLMTGNTLFFTNQTLKTPLLSIPVENMLFPHTRMADVADTELLDYEEEEQTAGADAAATGDAATANGTNGAGAKDGAKKDAVKGTYVSIHSSGFRDFLLKPEILRAIVDCGFEHPSEGECRYVCINQV